MGGRNKGFFGSMIESAIYRGMMEMARDPKTGKVDPYAAAGIACGTGRVKSAQDLARFGAHLGAAGAFDSDPVPLRNLYDVDDDELEPTCDEESAEDEYWQASESEEYAWRDDWEEGFEFGVDPEDYDTEEEYKEALEEAKYGWRDDCEDGSEWDVDPEDYETEEEYEEALEEAKDSWRDDCEDGSEWDVDPEDYETEEEYEEALEEAKEALSGDGEESTSTEEDCSELPLFQIVCHVNEVEQEKREETSVESKAPAPEADEAMKYHWRAAHTAQAKKYGFILTDYETEEEFNAALQEAEADKTVYTFCGVMFPGSNTVYHYLTDDDTLSVGDLVVVPVGNRGEEKICEVETVQKHRRRTAPYPVQRAKHIKGRYAEQQEK